LEFTIQDIIALQDFKLAKGVTTYPVTLLWYPRMRDPNPDHWSIASDLYPFADASLLPARGSSPTRIELSSLPDDPLALESNSNARPDPPPAPTKKQAKGKAKGPHKRQISEAIPRAEREVTRAPVTQEAPEEEALEAPEATRKSVRARKPKSRE
jgi:hypothetical protein